MSSSIHCVGRRGERPRCRPSSMRRIDPLAHAVRAPEHHGPHRIRPRRRRPRDHRVHWRMVACAATRDVLRSPTACYPPGRQVRRARRHVLCRPAGLPRLCRAGRPGPRPRRRSTRTCGSDGSLLDGGVHYPRSVSLGGGVRRQAGRSRRAGKPGRSVRSRRRGRQVTEHSAWARHHKESHSTLTISVRYASSRVPLGVCWRWGDEFSSRPGDDSWRDQRHAPS